MGQKESKPQQLIAIEKGSHAVYNVKTVKKMIKNGPADMDSKVFVICISGVFRSGKTFLLNLLKTYLDHVIEHDTDDGWTESSGTEIIGGNWDQGQQVVTHGVWMYMYPKLVHGIAIGLMDCQGSMDTIISTPSIDNLILSAALHLSDVHISNVDGVLNTDDFTHIDVCTQLAKNETGKLGFCRQLFLIRNWPSADEPLQLDQLIEGEFSTLLMDMAKRIKETFKAVEIDALPYPGTNVDGKSACNNVKIGDVDANFKLKARELFNKLLLLFPSEANRTYGEFLASFELLSKRSLVAVPSSNEAYEDTTLKEVYKKSSEQFEAEVDQLGNLKDMTMEQLEQTVRKHFIEAKEMFLKSIAVKRCQHQGLVDDYLKDLENNFKQMLKFLKSTLEAQQLQAGIDQKKKKKEADDNEIIAAKICVQRAKERIAKLNDSEKAKVDEHRQPLDKNVPVVAGHSGVKGKSTATLQEGDKSLIANMGEQEIGEKNEELKKQQEKSEKQKEEFGLQKEELGQQKEELGQQKEELVQQKEELVQQKEEQGKQKEELGQQKEELGQQKEEQGKQKEELGQQKEELGKQKEELERQREELERQREGLERQREGLGQQKEELDKQKEEQGKQKEELERQREELERQREGLGQQKEELDKQKEELERQREELGQQKEETEKQNEEIKNDLSAFEQKLMQMQVAQEEFHEHLKSLEAERQERLFLLEKVKNHEEEIAELKTAVYIPFCVDQENENFPSVTN